MASFHAIDKRKIKVLMAKTGINQQQLSKRVGVAPPTISQWLNGHHEPGATNLLKLAVALSAKVSDVLIDH